MADFSKFRSALNGFNRSDVANYIETSSAQHQTALQELQKQIDTLTSDLAQAQAASMIIAQARASCNGKECGGGSRRAAAAGKG